jgi:hypothetical protein
LGCSLVYESQQRLANGFFLGVRRGARSLFRPGDNPICKFKVRSERLLNTGVGAQIGWRITAQDRFLFRFRAQTSDQKENRQQKY